LFNQFNKFSVQFNVDHLIFLPGYIQQVNTSSRPRSVFNAEREANRVGRSTKVRLEYMIAADNARTIRAVGQRENI
jgi:hypothetical protein